MLIFDRPERSKTKEELKEIAKLIVEALKKENLLIGQAKRVLVFARDEIEWQILD